MSGIYLTSLQLPYFTTFTYYILLHCFLRRPVVQYKYSNGPYCGMSLAFNQRGDRLLVIGRRMPPLVYDVTKPRPIHEFHHTGYYSTCTIKSCCWAGPKCEVSSQTKCLSHFFIYYNL